MIMQLSGYPARKAILPGKNELPRQLNFYSGIKVVLSTEKYSVLQE